ncbi:hypothetical protein JCGZ_15761 [Jatropha curcas]|uniref:J domain-containing protein n=1 Tax=Jatropha curcas TaxID=180498 RepID=A0A067LB67_JATCU|nr:hypothetical protein JCGZ_15761 [Jatropha curcas]
MRGEGASRNYSMPRGHSGKKGMRSCQIGGNFDNVVIIDVDSGFDNVIIIDIPESLQQKSRGSSVLKEGKTFPIQGIISIDDDDERDFVEHPELNLKNGVGSDNSETPSKNKPATDCMKKSEDVDADDCQVVLEKRPAFKLSKCKKTYTKKSPPRNRYGLNSDSESDSSESSSSDFEVMEGSSCDLRDQWEKASLNRKSNNYDKGHSGPEDQASPSSSTNDTHTNVGVENRTKQNPEPPVSHSENVNFQDVVSSKFRATKDGFSDGGFNPWMEYSFAKSRQNINKENFSCWWKSESRENTGFRRKAGIHSGGETYVEDRDVCYDECQSGNGYGIRIQNERKGPPGPPPWSIYKGENNQCPDTSCFQHSEQKMAGERSFPSSQVKHNVESNCKSATIPDVDASFYWSQGEIHSDDHTRVVSMEKDSKLTCEASSFEQSKSIAYKEKDKLVSGTLLPVQETNPLTTSTSNIPSYNGKDPSYAPSDDAIAPIQGDIINEREKLKETEAYKRAIEEEWAARQRELQIQAEEAQRLRKRKKAESLRILDMEKRQRQRVEEVRETQRKDEENLNIKEILRAEVRKELCQMENTCIDMASLLRGLGIQVGGGFHPLSHEVHAAYKRALLKFHPDRASKIDIRQQVEAEEKFKLISRMKEKFLSTSCH